MKMTVLIADDNPEMLKALASFLSTSFAVVGEARNGAAALSGIEELHPDLAVLDVSMPLMNGFEVARRLRQTESPTRVVFCTLLRDAEFIAEARRCGHGYVLKSRLACDLPTALEAALNGGFFASLT
jgi:DNA-binding NarL/FixJ family response regulator